MKLVTVSVLMATLAGAAFGQSGVKPVREGGTGTGTIPANGELLIGNGTDYAVTGLTAGAGISIVNGAGTITVTNTGGVVGPGTTNFISKFTGAATVGDSSLFDDGADLTSAVSTAGALRTYRFANTSNTASASARLEVEVAGGTADDPEILFDIASVQQYVMGIDNDASDAWILSVGSALGTSNAIEIDTGGTVTLVNGMVANERADHPIAPSAGLGILWVRNDTPNVLVFTDDAGTDTVLGSGGGIGGSGTINRIPIFTAATTLGDSSLDQTGTVISVLTGNTFRLVDATASRILSTDASKDAVSVTDLTTFIAGTANRVTVANDGDGTVTLSGPQDIATSSSPTFVRGTFTQTTGTAPFTISSTTVVANLNADLLDGQHGSFYQDASNINAGTLAVNRGGTGQTSYVNGELLIGNTTGNTLTKSTLTAGTGIGIVNGTGSITISNTGVTGSGTTNVVPKFTGASAIGDSVISEDTSRIFINAAETSITPDTGADDLVIESSATAYGMSFLGDGTTPTTTIAFGDAADADIGKIEYDHSDNSLNWSSAAGRAMRWENQFGTPLLYAGEIASALPGTQVGLWMWVEDGSAGDFSLVNFSNSASSGMGFEMSRSRGTLSSPSAVTDGDELGQINWGGRDGSGSYTINAQIQVNVEGTVGASAVPTEMIFSTENTGGTLTAAMVIDDAQNTLIGSGVTAADVFGTVLTVYDGGSGASAQGELGVEDNGDAGITIGTPNTDTGFIHFSDPQDNDIGIISYDHSGNDLSITVDAAVGMIISDTQQTIVGASVVVGDAQGNFTSKTGDAGIVTADAGADEIIAEGSGATGISIIHPAANIGTLQWSTPTVSASLFYDPANNDLVLASNDIGCQIELRTDANTVGMVIDDAQAVYFPGIGTTASSANAFLDNGSTPAEQLLRSTSKREFKFDITREEEKFIKVVMDLEPITFKSKLKADRTPDGAPKAFYGFTAEQVYKVDPRLTHLDKDGNPTSVQYDRIAVPLIAWAQVVEKRLAQIESFFNNLLYALGGGGVLGAGALGWRTKLRRRVFGMVMDAYNSQKEKEEKA